MRAVLDLDRQSGELAQPREHGRYLLLIDRFCGYLRLPRQAKQRPAFFLKAAELLRAMLDDLDVILGARRSMSGPAAHQHAIAPHDQRFVRVNGIAHAME